jgi:hypothetical protein
MHPHLSQTKFKIGQMYIDRANQHKYIVKPLTNRQVTGLALYRLPVMAAEYWCCDSTTQLIFTKLEEKQSNLPMWF